MTERVTGGAVWTDSIRQGRSRGGRFAPLAW